MATFYFSFFKTAFQFQCYEVEELMRKTMIKSFTTGQYRILCLMDRSCNRDAHSQNTPNNRFYTGALHNWPFNTTKCADAKMVGFGNRYH